MDWSNDVAQEEFGWLRMMARLKYDGYRDFQAGVRFVESLASWLQQFSDEDRKAAYSFLKNRLVYISPGEKRRLVEKFFPQVIHNRIVRIVASELNIPPYSVLANPDAARAIETLKRQTLIMGLSDGAQLDVVRHANVGRLSNEQIVPTTQIDQTKWRDLVDELRSDSKDESALFRLVCLVDDFTASGSSFLRYEEKEGEWKGKIIKFRDSLNEAQIGTQPRSSIN